MTPAPHAGMTFREVLKWSWETPSAERRRQLLALDPAERAEFLVQYRRVMEWGELVLEQLQEARGIAERRLADVQAELRKRGVER